MAGLSDVIAVKDLRKEYQTPRGAVLALVDVGFTVREGEFVAIVGPSGCGKSTLLKILAGLLPATRGEVKLRDVAITGPRRDIGMVFQSPVLFPWRTVLDNVLLPVDVQRLERNGSTSRALDLLALVGLRGFEHRYPWELSGGMQQRASLCRALIHEPQLLMLDEPFAALDAFTREELWCVIRDLHRARAITVILVTHDLREAVFLADRVFVMSARPGRIVAERRIAFARPRDLELTFTPAFQDIAHELREHIVRARR
jgi:NitT/TauT family transport system ATP-binding protein